MLASACPLILCDAGALMPLATARPPAGLAAARPRSLRSLLRIPSGFSCGQASSASAVLRISSQDLAVCRGVGALPAPRCFLAGRLVSRDDFLGRFFGTGAFARVGTSVSCTSASASSGVSVCVREPRMRLRNSCRKRNHLSRFLAPRNQNDDLCGVCTFGFPTVKRFPLLCPVSKDCCSRHHATFRNIIPLFAKRSGGRRATCPPHP